MRSINQRINSYIAMLAITIVGAMAAFVIMKVADGDVPVFTSIAAFDSGL